MKSYPADFRQKVLAARDAGELTHDVALRFKVSKAWVRRIMQQRRETGQVAAKTTRDRTPKWRAWEEWLLAKIAAKPDIYLRELQADLKSELGETASLGLLCAACGQLERTRKKRHSSRQSKIAPTSSSGAKRGARRRPTCTPTKSSSSTKRGRKRI